MEDDEKPIEGLYAHVSNAVLWVFFWTIAVPAAIVVSVLMTWGMTPPYHTRRWLTGGRPMQRVSHGFTDTVSGRVVDYYVDKFGRFYLAEGPWSVFRHRVREKDEESV